MNLLRLSLFGALISLPLTSAGAADCTLKKLASFDAKIDSGMLMIKGKIDDRDVNMALDTGAPFNMIDNKLVGELKLPTNYGTIAGVDAAGHETRISALAHKVALGDLVATNVNFLIGGRDSANGAWQFDALIGSLFLESEDLELDLAHGKVNIFSSDHCAGQGVYWAREFVPIPISVRDQADFSAQGFIHDMGHIYLPVALDGVETVALLDTGSSRSLVDKHFAEGKLDVPTDGGKDKPDGSLVAGSGATIPFYKHTFGVFDIGGIAFRNTELAVMHNKMTHHSMDENDSRMSAHVTLRDTLPVDAPVTFGLQHMAKLRMYFSFKEKMLYVTPANAQ